MATSAKGRDPLSIVEAAYDLSPGLEGWLQGLAEAVRPHLDCGYGTQAVIYCPAEGLPQPVRIHAAGLSGTPPEMMACLQDMLPRVAQGHADAMRQQPTRLRSFSEMMPPKHRGFFADGRADLGGRPLTDFKSVLATDGPAWLLLAGGLSPRWEKTTAAERRLWQRLATHLTSAGRLMWGSSHGAIAREQAVLAPGGRLLHAEGDARDRTARERLIDAARAIDRARGRLRHSDPMRSLELWRGLVDGRWSLVDRFESDGRRFIVAMRNDSPHRDPRALTRRQGQVAQHVMLGLSNKEIGYSLGLSASAVGSHVSATLRKLRLGRREELAAEMAARDVRTSSDRVGDLELAVASTESASRRLPGLTPAEQEVVGAALRGESDAAIAKGRGRSPRTVANQLRSAFAKLGVSSRGELIARARELGEV